MSKLERLQDRIYELEELLGLHLERRLDGFSELGWQLLGLLLKHRIMPREFAHRALYGGRPEADQPSTPRAIDQHLCRLKKRLRKHGISVMSEAGTGYYLDKANKERLAELVNSGENNGQPDNVTVGRGRSRTHVIDRSDMDYHNRIYGVVRSPYLGMAPNRVATPKHHRSHSNAT